jgi:hypothetical protein
MLSGKLNLVLKVIFFIIAALISTYFISRYLGFDFFSFISTGPLSIEDLSQPKELSTLPDYKENADLGHGGMILERGAGEYDITNELKSRKIATGCSDCLPASCTGIDLNVLNPGFEAYKCSDCDSCSGITKPGRFKNCWECDTTLRECSICDDTEDEYSLCKQIKRDCLPSYSSDSEQYKKYGCIVTEIDHNDNVPFNLTVLNDFLNILADCKNEPIKLNMGHGIEKELCYFNTTDIAYYDYNKKHDFYISIKSEDTWSGLESDSVDRMVGEVLTPFYREGVTTYDRYRIYVSLYATPNQEYQVYLGNFSAPYSHIYDTKPNPIGAIITDDSGSGHAEFIQLPEGWVSDLKKQEMNGVTIEGPTIHNAYVAFYANMPESAEVWSKDLRYSHSNFNTDPELYLQQRPWWVLNLRNKLDSPLYLVSGNENSSIKVFYDSSMPGGGISSLRGNVKISIGRFEPDFQRNCKFDIYISSQDAFAEYDEEGITLLTDFLTHFDPTSVYKDTKDGKNDIIVYNTFKLNLDKNYTLEEVKSAIKTGFRLWEQNEFVYNSFFSSLDWLSNDNNDGIYENSWTEAYGYSNFDEDCWNNDIYNFLKFNNKRGLFGNCPGGICSEELKLRVAFKYVEPNAYSGSPWKKPLYPVITFCSKPPTTCNDGDLDPGEDCDPPQDVACPGECQSDCSCKRLPPSASYTVPYSDPSSCTAGGGLAIGGIYYSNSLGGTCDDGDYKSDVVITSTDGSSTGSYLDYSTRKVSSQVLNDIGGSGQTDQYIFAADSDDTTAVECCSYRSGVGGHCIPETYFLHLGSGKIVGIGFGTFDQHQRDLGPIEDIKDKMREKWCGDSDRDCLLCGNTSGGGGISYGQWYLCQGNVVSLPSGTGLIQIDTDDIVKVYNNGVLDQWQCKDDGYWVKL